MDVPASSHTEQAPIGALSRDGRTRIRGGAEARSTCLDQVSSSRVSNCDLEKICLLLVQRAEGLRQAVDRAAEGSTLLFHFGDGILGAGACPAKTQALRMAFPMAYPFLSCGVLPRFPSCALSASDRPRDHNSCSVSDQ